MPKLPSKSEIADKIVDAITDALIAAATQLIETGIAMVESLIPKIPTLPTLPKLPEVPVPAELSMVPADPADPAVGETEPGVLFSFDASRSEVKRLTYMADFREVCPEIVGEFVCESRLVFDTTDTCVMCRGAKWTVVSYEEVQTSSGYYYRVRGVPYGLNAPVMTEVRSSQEFADMFGVSLVEKSLDLEFPVVERGCRAYQLLRKVRSSTWHIGMQGEGDPMLGYFLWLDERGLVSLKWADLESVGKEAQLPAGVALDFRYVLEDLESAMLRVARPRSLGYREWLSGVLKEKLVVTGPMLMHVGDMLKLSYVPEAYAELFPVGFVGGIREDTAASPYTARTELVNFSSFSGVW